MPNVVLIVTASRMSAPVLARGREAEDEVPGQTVGTTVVTTSPVPPSPMVPPLALVLTSRGLVTSRAIGAPQGARISVADLVVPLVLVGAMAALVVRQLVIPSRTEVVPTGAVPVLPAIATIAIRTETVAPETIQMESTPPKVMSLLAPAALSGLLTLILEEVQV